MASVTKNFSFNLSTTLPYTAEGGSWAATTQNATATIDTTEDSPNDTNSGNGTLQTFNNTKNKTSANYWEWTGTWENLGVPQGATVTAVNGSYDWRCSSYSSGNNANVGALELRDSGGSLRKTIISGTVSITGTTSWATRTGTNQTGLSDDSNTTIKIRMHNNCSTQNSTGANVQIRQDWVTITVTYYTTTTTTLSKSLSYRVLSSSSISKSQSYKVLTSPSAISKGLNYKIGFITSVSKGLEYKVIPSTQISKSLSYKTLAFQSIPKNFSYTAILTAQLSKSLSYLTIFSTPLDKELEYKILTSTPLSKELSYSIFLESFYQIPKELTYSVLTSTSKDLPFSYKIILEREKEKELEYKVLVYFEKDKQLKYAILVSTPINKELRYDVLYEKTYTQDKELEYKVLAGEWKEKELSYFVIYESVPLEKQLEYIVETEKILNFDLDYKVKKTKLISKSISYWIEGQKQNFIIVDDKVYSLNEKFLKQVGSNIFLIDDDICKQIKDNFYIKL